MRGCLGTGNPEIGFLDFCVFLTPRSIYLSDRGRGGRKISIWIFLFFTLRWLIRDVRQPENAGNYATLWASRVVRP